VKIVTYDDFAKQLMLDQLKDGINIEIKVTHLAKSFDMLIFGNHPVVQKNPFLPTFFKLFSQNIIEFKSGYDHYDEFDVSKLIGDFGYYCNNKQISIVDTREIFCECLMNLIKVILVNQLSIWVKYLTEIQIHKFLN
jgi:hypothetical protein